MRQTTYKFIDPNWNDVVDYVSITEVDTGSYIVTTSAPIENPYKRFDNFVAAQEGYGLMVSEVAMHLDRVFCGNLDLKTYEDTATI